MFLRISTIASAALLAAAPLFAQLEKEPKPEDPSIVTSPLDQLELVVKTRPILPEMTTGDPLRVALHFEKKDGPIDHSDQELAHQLIERAQTLKSIEIAVKAPGDKWQVLKPDAEAFPEDRAPQRSLVGDATLLLELGGEHLKVLNLNGQEELAIPWKSEAMLKPGKYEMAIRGTLHLATRERTVQERGKPPMKFPATTTDVAFRTQPISIEVARADMRNQTLEELAKAAVEEVKKLPAVKDEELTVQGVESIPIADAEGNRIIRVRANIPQPKPRPGPDGGLIIGPVIAGGTGYWQYEVAMSPEGKPQEIRRVRKGFCIARGTAIATPDGQVRIEDLRTGHQVWAYDVKTPSPVPVNVLGIFPSQVEATIVINGKLRTTADHPVLVMRDGRQAWKPAAEVEVGDTMLNADGRPTRVAKVETIGGEIDVFDVAVDGPHNFFAGGLLVHNKSIAWTPQAFVPWYALWNRAPAPK